MSKHTETINKVQRTYQDTGGVLIGLTTLICQTNDTGLINNEGYYNNLRKALDYTKAALNIAISEYEIWKEVSKYKDEELDKNIKREERTIGEILSALVSKKEV